MLTETVVAPRRANLPNASLMLRDRTPGEHHARYGLCALGHDGACVNTMGKHHMFSTGSDLWHYLFSPPALVAVLIPGLASLIILTAYASAHRISARLRLLWIICLPVTLASTRWIYNGDLHELYLVSVFSVACLLVIFRRMYISPILIYALTFLSLGTVDAMAAFSHALKFDLPLDTFYYGVGGAGFVDSLFVVPLGTALVAAYATARVKTASVALVEF